MHPAGSSKVSSMHVMQIVVTTAIVVAEIRLVGHKLALVLVGVMNGSI